jgi:hypothetical protein
MRPDSKGTRFVRDGNCVPDFESLFRYERGATGAEVTVERVTEVPRRAGTDHRPGNVWPADGCVPGFVHDHLDRKLDSESSQTFDDLHRAASSPFPEELEPRFEQAMPRHVERKNMDLAVAVLRAQLDAGYDAHTERFSGKSGEWNTCNSVVVSERQRRDTRGVRRSDDTIWRQDAVGSSRVRVKVDEARWPRRRDVNHRA